MIDRLGQLLRQHEVLYGVICRDVTLTEIELMAQAGYHIVWLDLEHSSLPTSEAIRLGRTITHLGMVPLVRIPELSRTHVQTLLDGGVEIIALPVVRDAAQASELVQLGKYPPLGRRGISSTIPGTGFTIGADPKKRLREVNDATHLMVLFESDEAYEVLDAILDVDGIDIVAMGPNDWASGLGLFGDEARGVSGTEDGQSCQFRCKGGQNRRRRSLQPRAGESLFWPGSASVPPRWCRHRHQTQCPDRNYRPIPRHEIIGDRVVIDGPRPLPSQMSALT